MRSNAFRSLLVASALLAACRGSLESESFTRELAGGYLLQHEFGDRILVAPRAYDGATPIIPNRVLAVGWDERWILARQRPVRYRRHGESGLREREAAPEAWWILDTLNRELRGPYDLPTFRGQRAALGVPEDLTIRDVEDLRPD